MIFDKKIILTQISDGAPGQPGAPGRPGNGYYIEANQEEVLVFITSKGKEISPAVLSIKLYELPLSDDSKAIDFSENYSFGYIGADGQYVSLITDDLSDYFEFNIEENIEGEGQEPTSREKFFTYDLKGLQKNVDMIPLDAILKFAYLQDGKEEAIKIIPHKLGTHEEMAQFNVEATKINAAVRDSYLQFDEKGMSLYVSGAEENAGIKIYKKTTGDSDEKVFWADGQGNLNIKGNIYADSGEFNGTVHATYADFEDGKIGGFKIEGTQLSSTDTDGSLVLNGADGSIVANKITLGTGATIAEYINLGGAQLMNPTEANEHRILQSGNISIKDDGIVNFGNITVNGENSSIYGVDNSWSISQDRAEFKNISVSGSIETAVFKQASTQAVGSSMLFMQSYKVNSVNGNVVTLDQAVGNSIPTGVKVWLVNNDNDYKEYTVQSSTETTITLDIPDNEIVTATVVLIIGIPDDKPLIFGVNGSNVKTANDHIFPRGLTINEYNNVGIDEGGNPKLPHLFLGDLSVLNGSLGTSYLGYGLYSDNVYLNGSLTTNLGDNSYAGINTLNGAISQTYYEHYVWNGKGINDQEWIYTETQDQTLIKNKIYYEKVVLEGEEKYSASEDTTFNPQKIYYERSKDNSKIVFWAGAQNTTTSAIQNAPFQITERGSIFASRATLIDSLTVGGEIHGTDIYTARLHGEGGALSIYDTSNGIIFKKGYDAGDKETFRICADGLRVGEDSPFIEILSQDTRSSIKIWGDLVGIKNGDQTLSLTTQSTPALYHQHSTTQSCGFYFEDGKTTYKINSGSQSNTKTIWTSNDIKLLGVISFAQNETDTGFQYQPATGGYDLYITQ